MPLIPDPCLKTVLNDTPLVVECFDKMGAGRAFHDVVVASATFAIGPDGLRPVTDRIPIVWADRYWDERGVERSSLRAAGDTVLFKPGTDLLVTGTARALHHAPVPTWRALVGIGGEDGWLMHLGLRLTGPCQWFCNDEGVWCLSRPTPVAAVELRHELAHGGAGAPNPAGVGCVDVACLDLGARYRAPQIHRLGEAPVALGEPGALVCPAPVARFWPDRVRHAGTYDEAWLADFKTAPYGDYPADFDVRFFHCAHPALISEQALKGHEWLVLRGMLADWPDWHARLPGWQIAVRAWDTEGVERLTAMRLDTLHVDLDGPTVRMVWRLTLPQTYRVHTIQLDLQRPDMDQLT